MGPAEFSGGHSERDRTRAVRILQRVLTQKRSLDEVLKEEFPNQRIPAWFRENTSGCLRRWSSLGLTLARCSRDGKPPKGELRFHLALAAYQLLAHDRTVPEKVVNEAVEEIKTGLGKGPSGYANAVLRKVRDVAKKVEKEFSAEALDLPEWIFDRLVASKGKDWTRAFAVKSLERPQTWIRKRSGEAEKKEELGSLGKDEIVQNVSSQQLVDQVAELGLGSRVLDYCAAPGGKAIALAWKGFEVVASDSNPRRRKRLQENLNRVELDALVQVVAPEELGTSTFDWVWVDAPCSGSGTLSKHPEIRWNRSESDLRSLMGLQDEILLHASKHVPPGGGLVYSVCSVLGEEGMDRLSQALPGWKIEREWCFEPQNSPHGEGMLAYLARRPAL